MNGSSPRPSMEWRIAQHITSDGAVIIPPRIAHWLDKQSGMTADRRINLRRSDPEAYIALAALHLAAERSESGTELTAEQDKTQQSDTWMSTSEAAKALGVTDRCVRKRCATGQLDAVMSGGRWLVNRHTAFMKNTAA